MDAQAGLDEAGADAVTKLRVRAEGDLLRVLGVRARVEVVEADVIPRTDFKARRVIDDRDLFRSLRQKMDGADGHG